MTDTPQESINGGQEQTPETTHTTQPESTTQPETPSTTYRETDEEYRARITKLYADEERERDDAIHEALDALFEALRAPYEANAGTRYGLIFTPVVTDRDTLFQVSITAT